MCGLSEPQLKAVKAAAPPMGLQIQVLNADRRAEIDAAFETIGRERPDAIFVGTSPFPKRPTCPIDPIGSIVATISDPANDPEVALQEKDRGELVRRALMRLSIEHREVIDLVYYHERSVDEAAQILDVPPATVLCAKEIGRIGQWG
jgi:hypothetical protein